ncbi:hypothetical protein LSH36_171g07011 [Paralvinella palmiformis]|uniref:Sulfotransferase domain-containing protein n=1 Tax=Paralvinella palmiformis TaxID=53620 RepID=A0AAD9N7L6_9ANNE|nr:hypothetical protein LSH36_171g07011 [Paralvinella palmiformis]
MAKYRLVKGTTTKGENEADIHNRLSTRKNARISPSTEITTGTPRASANLLSILKLFVLVCVLSLLLTLALFYIVTHRPDIPTVNSTSQDGDKPPLPVEDKDDEANDGNRPYPGQLQSGKRHDKVESIILSKMMEIQGDHLMVPPESHQGRAPSVELQDTPFHRHKMEAKSDESKTSSRRPPNPGADEKLKEAILKELSPRTRMPPSRSEGGVKPPSAHTPVPRTRPTPAPPRHHIPKPSSHRIGGTPTPVPERKQPPGLPVVRHVSRDTKPPMWQEKATLPEIENFIFDTTPFVNFSMGVNEEQIENFQVILPSTIPNYRSPCWLEDVPRDYSYERSAYRCHVNFRRITSSYDFMESVLLHRQLLGRRWRIRCLPAFYLIGVIKSGTSDMYECLSKHPNILQPEIKEPEYWSRQRFEISPWVFKKDCLGDRKTVKFSEYLDIYDKSSEAIRLSMNKRLDGSLFSDVVFGDFSTHTFVQLVGWDKTLDSPRYISAHHIHQIAPQSKFIIMLRDPVERAYSRYKMRFTRRQNVQGTAAEFHLRMVREVKDAANCMKGNSKRSCVYKENFGREGYHTMLVHGLYVVYLNDWLSIIPRDQFYVVRFEDYIEDRLEYVEDIAYFLGVGSFPEYIRREIEKMPTPNPSANIGPMLNETRAMLREFYRPFNHELADVLHDTRYKWGY